MNVAEKVNEVLKNYREYALRKLLRARLETKKQYWEGYLKAIITVEKLGVLARREA